MLTVSLANILSASGVRAKEKMFVPDDPPTEGSFASASRVGVSVVLEDMHDASVVAALDEPDEAVLPAVQLSAPVFVGSSFSSSGATVPTNVLIAPPAVVPPVSAPSAGSSKLDMLDDPANPVVHADAAHFVPRNKLVSAMSTIVALNGQRGANLDFQNRIGRIALYSAAINDYDAVVKILLDAGASIDIQDGNTALHVAANQDYRQVAKLLLDAGANFDVQDDQGSTALYMAADRGFSQVVKILLDRGANIEMRSGNSLTPLLIAARSGHVEVVEVQRRHFS
jgi:hypothetical protein